LTDPDFIACPEFFDYWKARPDHAQIDAKTIGLMRQAFIAGMRCGADDTVSITEEDEVDRTMPAGAIVP